MNNGNYNNLDSKGEYKKIMIVMEILIIITVLIKIMIMKIVLQFTILMKIMIKRITKTTIPSKYYHYNAVGTSDTITTTITSVLTEVMATI